MNKCLHCKNYITKDIEVHRTGRSKPDGVCRLCRNERERRNRAAKPIPEKYKRLLQLNEEANNGVRTCVTCKILKPLEEYSANKDSRHTKCKLCVRAWYYERAERIKESNRERYHLIKYGLTADEADLLRLMNCQICNINSDMVIDHCHTLGVVRGVLCRKCNSALGLLNHDKSILDNAIKYLGVYDEIKS